MRIGIDVGGTHTDAVVVDGGRVVASAKVVTDHHNLLSSVQSALQGVLKDIDPKAVSRLNLSTTLSTNAIVEGRTEDVGVLVSAGPGIDPDDYQVGPYYYTVSGSIDHRGEEIAPPDVQEVDSLARNCCETGLKVYAVVGKFSTRNPAHEIMLTQGLMACADFVSQGHRLSGQLNFPRRIATAYYNSAVWRIYNKFADAIEESVREYGIYAPVHILKADGGTMPLATSREHPVESILSGPAASVMGIIALCDIQQDSIILDIGGTTTDIAIFASGSPVIENDGIEVGSYPTLVRALRTRSIGIGGDSRLHVQAGAVRVGPERVGPCMAAGGKQPTLIDALIYKGLAEFGDVETSKAGIRNLASLWDMFPDALADAAIDAAVNSIASAVEGLLDEVNSRPVYTIMELIEGAKLEPSRVYVMGGPAKAFSGLLTKALQRRVEVPEEHAIANAIGAALTRTTFELELFADTEKGVRFIPTLGIRDVVQRGYVLEHAQKDAVSLLLEHLGEQGVAVHERDVDILEANSFNMVGDYGTVGRNIRVKCQVRPGVAEAFRHD
ncbi:hydantoinase/oxoprolinase family protein [Desulfovibrio mangrovi]|uniref:hydantoinase/oxoprolinase family protein n=1 Tax=Desulfovibrio mangrovi TaxID=2976983 RepID=UPI002245A3E9|nr:hydantoinase/oxoprolinase family protein [Desulfovibrio mangrovi]UZP68046.1 hydantoinase/oxoprolinase family protein [Desulfovibrio mangrovi]